MDIDKKLIRKILLSTLLLSLLGCDYEPPGANKDKELERDFIIVDEEALHYSDVKRFNIYITIDTKKSDEARVKKSLEDLVDTYIGSGRDFNALSIFVFRPEDEEKIGSINYTLAKGVYAPNGRWEDASKVSRCNPNICSLAIKFRK